MVVVVCSRKAAEGGASEPSNDISERQPMFLKDKGDALFGKGNYQAARERERGTGAGARCKRDAFGPPCPTP